MINRNGWNENLENKSTTALDSNLGLHGKRKQNSAEMR